MKNLKNTIPMLCVVAMISAVGCGGENNNNGSTNNTSGTTGSTNNTTGATNNTTGGGETYCRLECGTAADCGTASDWECNNSRCDYIGDVAAGCTMKEECTAQFSGWSMECQTDAECTIPGNVCVDIGDADAGRCANAPSDLVDCATLQMDDLVAERFEDGTTADVCANTTADCHPDGYCFEPCTTDDDCGDLLCDTTAGTCYCDDDAQCTGVGSDACQDNGTCGCAAEASCDALEDGGMSYICE